MAAGSDLEATNAEGENALHAAAKMGNQDCVRSLVKYVAKKVSFLSFKIFDLSF